MIRENLTKNNSKSLNNKIRLIDSEWQSPNNLNEQYSINDKIKTTLNNKNRKRNKISNPQPAEFDGRLASSVAINCVRSITTTRFSALCGSLFSEIGSQSNKIQKRNKISNPQPAEFDGRLASSVAIIVGTETVEEKGKDGIYLDNFSVTFN